MKKIRSVLTKTEEQIICEFRRQTLFYLDDCYINLKDIIPKLSRSNLYHALRGNGLNILPKTEEKAMKGRGKFVDYKIGFVHIDVTQFHHLWTNVQVEIMNKTIKNHTLKKYHYDDFEQLKNHLNDFLIA